MHALQVDPSVSAVVHYVRSLWFKHQKDFAEFYKASLLYLAFISSDALPPEQRLVCPRAHAALPCALVAASAEGCCCAQSLAVDISLAALLGDSVYNFGELLLHPIVRMPCPVPCLS
jgi:26S proteasome regulatory subunit N9